jgi:hypothetical protein
MWVRHEALLFRMEVRDRPFPRRRSARLPQLNASLVMRI